MNAFERACGSALLMRVICCALVFGGCTSPVEAVRGPCSHAGTMTTPGTVTRHFDPDGCSLKDLEDRPFIGTEPDGTFRYDRFALAVPPRKAALLEWAQPIVSGLVVRVYDEDGSVVTLNGIGWYLMNPGTTTPRTYQVLVAESDTTVRGTYRLSLSSSDYADPISGDFELETIGGQRLPVTVWATSYLIQMDSGFIRLRPDWTFDRVGYRSYAGGNNAGSESGRGTYSRGGNSLALQFEMGHRRWGRMDSPTTVVIRDFSRHELVDFVYR